MRTINSTEECAKKVRNIPLPENVQLPLFSYPEQAGEPCLEEDSGQLTQTM